MNKKNEKGFALVLSLVLLMAMSLMGGALIVISASDHQSNNVSDEYQQTFYVAETALIEGEKYLINQYKGPYDNSSGKRILSLRGLPKNSDTVKNPPSEEVKSCYNSYSDIDRATFKPIYWRPVDDQASPSRKEVVIGEGNYYEFISSKIVNHDISVAERATEERRLRKFKYQFFLTEIGEASFKGTGESIKKGATDSGKDGMAFRIFGCGIFDNDKIVVPLESIMVLPKG